MIKFVIFFLATASVALACFPNADLTEDPSDLFEQYIVVCGKSYANDAEKQYRFRVFQTNLEEIQTRSANITKQGFQTPHGINIFADMTQSEFESSYGSYNSVLQALADGVCDTKNDTGFTGFSRNISYQDVYCMTSVQDQGNCTADWAILTAANIADNYCLASGEWCEVSYQQAVDCTPDSKGCQGGLWSASAARINWMPGILRNFQYPYVGKQGVCQYALSKAIFKSVPWPAYPWETENQMRDTMDQRIVFVITVDATNWQYITGDGIIGEGDPDECCLSDETHYVEVVGYGTNARGTPYWLVKNTWGTGWGDNGLARIIAGQNCYLLTAKFGYFPVQNNPGECTKAGPLPFTPPTPPSDSTIATNPTEAPTSAPAITTTVSTTAGPQSCNQCGQWRLIWQILQAINSNNTACVIQQ